MVISLCLLLHLIYTRIITGTFKTLPWSYKTIFFYLGFMLTQLFSRSEVSLSRSLLPFWYKRLHPQNPFSISSTILQHSFKTRQFHTSFLPAIILFYTFHVFSFHLHTSPTDFQQSLLTHEITHWTFYICLQSQMFGEVLSSPFNMRAGDRNTAEIVENCSIELWEDLDT